MKKKTLRHHLVWWLILFSRWLLGLTFIFSGFVKSADPMGMSYKLQAYAVAVEFDLGEDSLLAQIGAIAIGAIEFVFGVYLLLGIRKRFTTISTLLLMCFMTLLTVWVYLENPVSDCGCFGDAVVLSNGATLSKNIVLLVAAIFVCYHHRNLRRAISERNQWLTSIYSVVYILGLGLYSLHYLPVMEFTPYKPGANIRASFYGEPENKGAERLANFYLSTLEGDDATETILADTGYTFILTVPHVETADDGCVDRINDLYDVAHDHGYAFYMATASQPNGIRDWIDRSGGAYPVLLAENTELKTMVRSNPGLVLLHNGRLAAKWSNNNLPQPEIDGEDVAVWTKAQSEEQPLTKLLLWYLIPLLVVILCDSLWIGSKYYKHYCFSKRLNKTQSKMRKKIVAGNWKMNKNLQEGVALAKELNEALAADKPNCGVIICTPFIHLASVSEVIDHSVIGLGAENCADRASGAYTGEVSAEMVKSTGAEYVILGHSERRAYYGETAEILKEKVNLALANNLDVIFCIGEVLEERESGKQNEVVKAQIEGSLFDLTAEQFGHIVLAYEPVWAIGTGKTATAEQAEEIHAFIRNVIAEKFGAEVAENVSILYGGSCKPSNAKEIFSKENVDGGLIGGAALKVADFKGIIDAWKA